MATLQGEKVSSSDISELNGLHQADRNRIISEAIRMPLVQFVDKFIIEMNAKNQAYYFILEHGYFNQFKDYCR